MHKTCRYGRTTHAPRFRCQFRHFARQRIHSSESQLVQSPKRPEAQAPALQRPTLWRKVKVALSQTRQIVDRVTAWNVGAVRATMPATAQRSRRGRKQPGRAEAMIQNKRPTPQRAGAPTPRSLPLRTAIFTPCAAPTRNQGHNLHSVTSKGRYNHLLGRALGAGALPAQLHDAALFLAQIGGGCDRIRTIQQTIAGAGLPCQR